MRKILIYSGTTEGRTLARILENAKVPADVSVATEYGRQVMEESDCLHVLEGRLSEEEMRTLYEKEDYLAVVDATHPFATLVTATIRKSLEGSSIPYLRLARKTDINNAKAKGFDSVEDCVEALKKTSGRILLTTGSKDLPVFCKNQELRERLVVRVLPGMESLQICYDNGLEGKQIIAMQGPFSEEMNLAQIKEYHIATVVTKESGTTGGVDTKLMACEKAGVTCFMIRKPEYTEVEELNLTEVCIRLQQLTGQNLTFKKDIHIDLVGIGPGNQSYLTGKAKEAMEKADLIFGAQRMLDSVNYSGQAYPYYLAKDIIPLLEEKRNCQEATSAVVLFSGDTGFYSGCQKLKDALEEADFTEVEIVPGISSLVYFAAKIGINYQDSAMLSTHGVEEALWKRDLQKALGEKKEIFLLTSGKEDVAAVHDFLRNRIDWKGRLYGGYQLSYEDESLVEITGESLPALKEGLYVLAVLSDVKYDRILTPHLRDEEFIRDQVPMTKEEIRHLSLCKLRLTGESVIYDIGSGTGSIAIEIAKLVPDSRVFAVEVNDLAVELIRSNCKKHKVHNVEVIQAKAPEGLDELPSPDFVFLGGSKGNMKEILLKIYEKNPRARVVMNAVSLESVCQMQQLLQKLPVEDIDITQVSVTKTRELGNYHMLTSNNPVFIFAFHFK